VPDAGLLRHAGDSYRSAGAHHDAARCYHDAGAHAEAARSYQRAGAHDAAAQEYVAASMVDDAIWMYAHVAGDTNAARSMAYLHPLPDTDDVAGRRARHLRDLALARCDVADATTSGLQRALAELDNVATWLALPGHADDPAVQQRAVFVAMAANRLDRAALIHAAASRSGSWAAQQRWRLWHRSVNGAELPALDEA
jgi:hypothetical protein